LRANFLTRDALQRVVNVIATQMRVTVRRQHLIISPSVVEISLRIEMSNVPPPKS